MPAVVYFSTEKVATLKTGSVVRRMSGRADEGGEECTVDSINSDVFLY